MMNFKVVVHKDEESGFWAEVPAIPGCMSQGDTREELTTNIIEAIRACLEVEFDTTSYDTIEEIFELAL